MRKLISLCAIALIIPLAACNNKKTPNAPEPSAPYFDKGIVNEQEWNEAFKIDELLINGNVTLITEIVNRTDGAVSTINYYADNGKLRIQSTLIQPGAYVLNDEYYFDIISHEPISDTYTYDQYTRDSEDGEWKKERQTNSAIAFTILKTKLFEEVKYDKFHYDEENYYYVPNSTEGFIALAEMVEEYLKIDATVKSLDGYVRFAHKRIKTLDCSILLNVDQQDYDLEFITHFYDYGATTVTLPDVKA